MGAPRNNNPVNGIKEEKLSQILTAACDAFAEEDALPLEATLRKEFEELGYDVKVIGDLQGNNKNFEITDRNDETKKFVVQATKKSNESEIAFESLRGGIAGMPDIYNDKSVKSKASKDPITIHVAAMEFCPGSLEKSTEACQGDDSRLQLAVNVGAQVSGILTSVKEKGLIWTDLKVGNLLMRDDDHIVVTDLKGFVDPDKLKVRETDGTLYFPEITPECVSESFVKNHQRKTKTYDEVKVIIDRENSYQMAIILYYIATGEKPYSAVETKGKEATEFDFKKPIFETAEGARLKTVIELLSHENPEKRIRHENAMKMMQVLKDGDALKREKDKSIKSINLVHSAKDIIEVKTRQNSNAIEERLKREAQKSQFDKFKDVVVSAAGKIGLGKKKSKSDPGVGVNQESEADKKNANEHKVGRSLSNK